MKLHIIRHGQSIANVNHELYKTMLDSTIPLSTLGEVQASNVELDLDPQSKVLMITSNYKRAIDTGSFINETFNLETYTDPLIHEFLLITDSKYLSRANDVYLKGLEQENLIYYKDETQAESYLDCYMRARLFLNSINSGYYKCDELVIVSHGVFIQMLLANIDRISIEDALNTIHVRNCEVLIREL